MATVVNPISITKTGDLDFGNVAPGINPGSVALAPDGSRTQSGGATLPGAPGTVMAATFMITGVPNVTYAITLPADPLPIVSGSNGMVVSQFSSDPPDLGNLGPTGSQELRVGATLSLAALQPTGYYSSPAPFAVIVNYN